MGEFNSDDHYIYYCKQESLRRNGVAIVVNKRLQNTVLGYNLQNNRMISIRSQGKNTGLPVPSPVDYILSFLRLHPSTAFQTLLLTMMATPFLLRDSCSIQ